MVKPRKKIDWESIENEYRAGQLSIREIARQHGCSDAAIHKKKNKLGWERDLTKRIQQRVSTKSVSSEVGNANANDEEIIEQMADRNVAAIKLMRQDIENLRIIEQKYITELNGEPTKLWIGQYKGQIVEKELSLTVTERAIAAANLANVQHKRIALERQAYNLDNLSGDESAPINVNITFHRQELHVSQ